jgi:hypothetical protein
LASHGGDRSHHGGCGRSSDYPDAGTYDEKEAKMMLHFLLLIGFLVVAHIAMIFGMLNPALF